MKQWIVVNRPLVFGAAALAIGLGLVLVAPREALTGWLAAFLFVSAMVFGGLFFVMLADIIPGSWCAVVRPPAAEIAAGMILVAIFSLPVLFGVRFVFPWIGDVRLSGFRAVYLLPWTFAARLIVFLGICLWLQLRLLRGPQRPLAIGGLIIFVLLDGVFATDLVLSLDPEFHSSGFGLYFLSIQALTGFAAIVLIRCGRSSLDTGERSMLGALFLALLLCWAYFDFMQYFIAWSGNLPANAAWFLRRSQGIWHLLVLLLLVLKLGPAFLLLFPPLRQSRRWLVVFATLTLISSVIEMAWLVIPELENPRWAVLSYMAAATGMILMMPIFRKAARRAISAGSGGAAHEGA